MNPYAAKIDELAIKLTEILARQYSDLGWPCTDITDTWAKEHAPKLHAEEVRLRAELNALMERKAPVAEFGKMLTAWGRANLKIYEAFDSWRQGGADKGIYPYQVAETACNKCGRPMEIYLPPGQTYEPGCCFNCLPGPVWKPSAPQPVQGRLI